MERGYINNVSIKCLALFFLLGVTISKAQYVANDYKRPLLIDASVSGIAMQYDKNPLGSRLGVGLRIGATQMFSVSNKVKLCTRVNYSQLGAKRFRVNPTGVIDTANIYNMIQIYEESTRLHYINLKVGAMRTVWSNGAVDVFVGVNAFSGLLLSARVKGQQLQGPANYNADFGSLYRAINYGVEPELGTIIHLSNGKFFLLTAAYELGIPNVFKSSDPVLQSIWSTEHTRAFTFTLSFPIVSR